MADIRFACACGKIIAVPASAAGKRGKCASCGRPLVVPGAAPGQVAGAKPEPPRSITSPPPARDELELTPPPPPRRVEPAGIMGMTPTLEERTRRDKPTSYPLSALDYKAPIRVRKPTAPRFFLSVRLIVLLAILLVSSGFALYRYLAYTPALGEPVVLEQFGVSFRPPADWKRWNSSYDRHYYRHPDLKAECTFQVAAFPPGKQIDLEKEIEKFTEAPEKLVAMSEGAQVKEKKPPRRYKVGSFDAVEIAVKMFVPAAHEDLWLYLVAMDVSSDTRVYLFFSHITAIGSGALKRLKEQMVKSVATAEVKVEPGEMFESKYFDYSLRLPVGFKKEEESAHISGYLAIFDEASQKGLKRRIRIIAYPTDTSPFDDLLKAYRIRREIELGKDGAIGADVTKLKIAGRPAARFSYTVKESEGISHVVQMNAHCIIDISVQLENAPRQYRDAIAGLLTSTLTFKPITPPPMGGRVEFEKPPFSLCIPQGWIVEPTEKPGKKLLATYKQADDELKLRVYGYSVAEEDIDEDEGLNLQEFAEEHMPRGAKQGTMNVIDLKETQQRAWPVLKVFYASLDSKHLLDTFVKLDRDKVLLLRVSGFGYHEKFESLADAVLQTVQLK